MTDSVHPEKLPEPGATEPTEAAAPRKRRKRPDFQRAPVSYPPLVRTVRFASPAVQSFFQRWFDKTNTDLSKFLRMRTNQGTAEQAARLKEIYKGVLAAQKAAIAEHRQRMRAIMEENGIDAEMGRDNAMEFQARITTPWTNAYLELYTLADDAFLDLHLLWITEAIDDADFKRTTVALRRTISTVKGQLFSAVDRALAEDRRRAAQAESGGESQSADASDEPADSVGATPADDAPEPVDTGASGVDAEGITNDDSEDISPKAHRRGAAS